MSSAASFKYPDAPLASADVHLFLLQARIAWPESGREALLRAAEILNAGKKVAILAGRE